MNARIPLMIALVFAGSPLAGCGKTGLLEQPAPLYGAEAKAEYAQRKQQDAEAKARANAAKKAEPQAPIVDDPNTTPLTDAPLSTPLPDHRSDPLGHGPQGSLPNPGTASDR
jgi:hypothetical protein